MTESPNWFAYFILFAWPLITLLFYRRMAIGKATIISIISAYLLLPENTEVDLPLLPPLNKYSIANISAFFICIFVLKRPIQILPKNTSEKIFFLGFLLSPFVTSALNPDPLLLGHVMIRGLTLYDGLSDAIRQFIILIPYLMAKKLLNGERNAEDILRLLVIAALIYSLPILVEIRLSPQLHRWIYGFFPGMFAQQIRGEGFRPVVFLGHGLWLTFFIMNCAIAATAFWRLRKRAGLFSGGITTLYLSVILIMCKSMASIIYGGVFLVLVRWIQPKTAIKIAVVLTIFVLTYPLLRQLEIFPVDSLVTMAAEVSAERANSLQQRFDQELARMERINERAFFGWGGWDRNGYVDTYGVVRGGGADGRWLITISRYGWIGYFFEYSLMAFPIYRLFRAYSTIPSGKEQIFLTTLCLIITVYLVDCLPNDPIRPLTWLLLGIISGRVDLLTKKNIGNIS